MKLWRVDEKVGSTPSLTAGATNLPPGITIRLLRPINDLQAESTLFIGSLIPTSIGPIQPF
jgi:hypothetical protein